MSDAEEEKDHSLEYSFSGSEMNRMLARVQIGSPGATQERSVGEGYVSPTIVHQFAGVTPPRVRPHLAAQDSYCVTREKHRAQQGRISRSLPVSPANDPLGISKVKGKPVVGYGTDKGQGPVSDPVDLLAKGLARVPGLGLPIQGGRASTPAKGRRSGLPCNVAKGSAPWENEPYATSHGAAGYGYAPKVHRGGNHGFEDKLRFAGLQLPQYQRGEHWGSFVTLFRREMIQGDIRPSHQLSYLLRAIPVDGRAYLRHKRVESIEHAYDELTLLYQPQKDMVELQLDFLDLKQKEGEDLVAFAGRLSEAAREYEAIGVNSAVDQERLVMQQFKRAVKDPRVRDRLVDIECQQMSLSALIHRAQKLEKHFEEGEFPHRMKGKTVRGVEHKSELEVLKDEMAALRQEQTRALAEAKLADNNFQSTLQDIKTQVQKWQRAPGAAPKPRRGTTPFQGKCFRCGEVGHFKRECRAKNPHKPKGETIRETVVVQATEGGQNEHLNWEGQQ